jgi:Ca2+-binding EF-hand superfamily protein
MSKKNLNTKITIPATSKQDSSDNALLVKLRNELLKRGVAGIKSIGVRFRILDIDNNKKIDFDEFKNGLLYQNVNMERSEMAELFALFDLNKDETLDFNEFLFTIRVFLNSFFKKKRKFNIK